MSSSGGDGFNASIEEIKRIANKTLGNLSDEASTKTRNFTSKSTDASAFSSYPLAQALGAQHEAARDVFRATIEGVLADLTTFQEQLLISAQKYEGVDDAAAAALAAVDRKFAAPGFSWQSNEKKEAAITAKGDALASHGSEKHTSDVTAAEPVSTTSANDAPPNLSTE